MGKTITFCVGIFMAVAGTLALVFAPDRFLLATLAGATLGLAAGITMRPRR